MPVSESGVRFGIAWSSGPFGFPPRNRLLSVAIVIVRGVWHSPQWATARTRYSPRGTPALGADAGRVSRGANAANHAGRNTDSKSGTEMRLGCFARFTGGTLFRNTTSALRSCRHPVEDGIRMHGQQPVAVGPTAEPRGRDDLFVGPGADARHPIRRDVARVHRAEGPIVAPPARIGRLSLRGVAAAAAGGAEHVAAALDLLLARLRRGGVGMEPEQRQSDGTDEQSDARAGRAHQPTNPLAGPLVPAGGGRGGHEATLHDQRVLAGVVVIPAATPGHAEVERLVQRDRRVVARAHLEDDHADVAGARLCEETSEQIAGDAAAPVRGVNRDIRDVELVGDLPDADVADDRPAIPNDVAACHAVLLDLVEEGAARPGHGERGPLDRQDLVEVPGAHQINGAWLHDAEAPLGRVADRVAPARRRRRCRRVGAARVPAWPRTPARARGAGPAGGARAASPRRRRRRPPAGSAHRDARPAPRATARGSPTRDAARRRRGDSAWRTPRHAAPGARRTRAAPPMAPWPPWRRAWARRRSAVPGPGPGPWPC